MVTWLFCLRFASICLRRAHAQRNTIQSRSNIYIFFVVVDRSIICNGKSRLIRNSTFIKGLWDLSAISATSSGIFILFVAVVDLQTLKLGWKLGQFDRSRQAASGRNKMRQLEIFTDIKARTRTEKTWQNVSGRGMACQNVVGRGGKYWGVLGHHWAWWDVVERGRTRHDIRMQKDVRI